MHGEMGMGFLGEGNAFPEALRGHQHEALRFNCGKCCSERNEM